MNPKINPACVSVMCGLCASVSVFFFKCWGLRAVTYVSQLSVQSGNLSPEKHDRRHSPRALYFQLLSVSYVRGSRANALPPTCRDRPFSVLRLPACSEAEWHTPTVPRMWCQVCVGSCPVVACPCKLCTLRWRSSAPLCIRSLGGGHRAVVRQLFFDGNRTVVKQCSLRLETLWCQWNMEPSHRSCVHELSLGGMRASAPLHPLQKNKNHVASMAVVVPPRHMGLRRYLQDPPGSCAAPAINSVGGTTPWNGMCNGYGASQAKLLPMKAV